MATTTLRRLSPVTAVSCSCKYVCSYLEQTRSLASRNVNYQSLN